MQYYKNLNFQRIHACEIEHASKVKLNRSWLNLFIFLLGKSRKYFSVLEGFAANCQMNNKWSTITQASFKSSEISNQIAIVWHYIFNICGSFRNNTGWREHTRKNTVTARILKNNVETTRRWVISSDCAASCLFSASNGRCRSARMTIATKCSLSFETVQD